MYDEDLSETEMIRLIRLWHEKHGEVKHDADDRCGRAVPGAK
jgi:hypothetical protein